MTEAPLIVERLLSASIKKVWEAITEIQQMKKWYFDIAEFKPEVGYEFEFTAGPPEKNYLHLCKITEVIASKKLAYSWRYNSYPGNSLITFELFKEDNKTKIRLTHSGLESFPKDIPDFEKKSFAKGWEYIIGTSLKNYVEK